MDTIFLFYGPILLVVTIFAASKAFAFGLARVFAPKPVQRTSVGESIGRRWVVTGGDRHPRVELIDPQGD